MAIEIIDLFAGPGGLGEGFSAFEVNGKRPFKIKISIEKEKFAHETLTLRAFYRQFAKTPKEYYQYLKGKINKEKLFEKYPKEAKRAQKEAYCAELGTDNFSHDEVIKRIQQQVNKPNESIIIGGPPCQSYSIAGRPNLSKKGAIEKDPRHVLYKEYFKIIADIQPRAFIMENVRGLLSSKLDGKLVFEHILEEAQNPSKLSKSKKKGAKYTIYSLSSPKPPKELQKNDFIVKTEDYGIPQCRHRVILLGIRNDIKIKPRILECMDEKVTVADVLDGLPKIRSGITRREDNAIEWKKAITQRFKGSSVIPKLNRGGEFVAGQCKPKKLTEWFHDRRLGGVLNHSTRSHMASDLHRYYFSADYAGESGDSPRLGIFPNDLLPNHKNAKISNKKIMFDDRFRVQLPNQPSTTVTAHLSSDGHYFIHYDKSQCRSLTPREAARLQTFPDNYKFEGSRTSQFRQVGNAVPPLLAYKIAEVVYGLIND